MIGELVRDVPDALPLPIPLLLAFPLDPGGPPLHDPRLLIGISQAVPAETAHAAASQKPKHTSGGHLVLDCSHPRLAVHRPCLVLVLVQKP